MANPNIFLVVLDSVRKDHLSTYGYGRPTTPTLDEFADISTKYTQAFSAGPWTPVSHGVMFTGQWPSNGGVYGLQPDLATDRPHIAELLSDIGYYTVGFSNSYHTSPDHGFDRGFDYYHDILSLPRFAGNMYEPSLTFVQHLYDYFVRDYDDSSFQLNKMLDRLDSTRQPIFGFINMNSAHSPYNPPSEFKREFESYVDGVEAADREVAAAYSKDAYQYFIDELEMSAPEWELVKGWYDGEIRYMDMLLEKFFQFLKSNGMFDDSMIIITSDHGEFFGEGGMVYHQFSLADILLNVPLLIKWPEQNEPRVSEDLVSLVDLAPTALSQTTQSTPESMDGLDLSETPDREAIYAEYAGPSESIARRMAAAGDQYASYTRGLQAVRTANHKLVVSADGERRLYEVADGSEEEITDEDLTDQLQERLDGTLDRLPEASVSEDLDPHIEDHLRDMGYM
ncbi:sulfatase-like hydrolase/transferase [Haloarcula onubensis]|uniref:Sulfatase-like hydrolase/transferase n=1 Tax=Haloarcula onubensis TaxID=2950539 RepID=A0ABU2FLV8_9EURY|nr:sulfatase-like hydrolase/transferase [Halomicroarcula sp. S3CR25-11]MDS0281740.1 sulfatase-like hydrolase/transferase [Halomicroarcula sp. S3CR25-11]